MKSKSPTTTQIDAMYTEMYQPTSFEKYWNAKKNFSKWYLGGHISPRDEGKCSNNAPAVTYKDLVREHGVHAAAKMWKPQKTTKAKTTKAKTKYTNTKTKLSA
jgi:hypothetical protein